MVCVQWKLPPGQTRGVQPAGIAGGEALAMRDGMWAMGSE